MEIAVTVKPKNNRELATCLVQEASSAGELILEIESALDERDQRWVDWLRRSPIDFRPTDGAVRDRVKGVLGPQLGTTTMTVDRFDSIVDALAAEFSHDPA